MTKRYNGKGKREDGCCTSSSDKVQCSGSEYVIGLVALVVCLVMLIGQ